MSDAGCQPGAPSTSPVHPQAANKQLGRKTHRGSCSLRFGWTSEGKLEQDETILRVHFFSSQSYFFSTQACRDLCRYKSRLLPLVLKDTGYSHSDGQSREITAGGTGQSCVLEQLCALVRLPQCLSLAKTFPHIC